MHSVILEKAKKWLGKPFDHITQAQVQELIEQNSQALIDAFYTDIEFGTAGMRGLVGVGTSKMNVYTIRKATQGIAHYLLQNTSLPKAVIAFDCRKSSREFAIATAQVFAGNGILTILLPEERPTPFLSFAVRALGADCGIMVTASHNPAEYNGYKVYGPDGAQVSKPIDQKIMQAVHNVISQEEIKLAPSDSPFIIAPPADLEDKYLAKAYQTLTDKQLVQERGAELSIIYSPLHGTGITLLPQVLQRAGFTDLFIVAEQEKMDGSFPTAPEPNPETRKALKLSCHYLLEKRADIAIATDPDADRLGVAVRQDSDVYLLSGNEIALIAFVYLAKKRHLKKPALITSIVTTPLLKKIAEAHHIAYFEVLTGFKYIAAKILEWENNPHGYDFLFGAEESYGYLVSDFVRDKDALTASQLLAEIALNAKLEGKTLTDSLLQIYSTYGLVRDKIVAKSFSPGSLGMEQMQNLMQKMRSCPPKSLLGKKVIGHKDYLLEPSIPSNVLALTLENNGRVVIRPSGTEPKIKLYASLDYGKKQFQLQDLIQADLSLEKSLEELIHDL